MGGVGGAVRAGVLSGASRGQHPPLVFPQVFEEGLALGLGFDEQDVHVIYCRFLWRVDFGGSA